MESLTLSSYQPKKSVPCGRARGFESKWNHLTTEDALPELTAGTGGWSPDLLRDNTCFRSRTADHV